MSGRKWCRIPVLMKCWLRKVANIILLLKVLSVLLLPPFSVLGRTSGLVRFSLYNFLHLSPSSQEVGPNILLVTVIPVALNPFSSCVVQCTK